MNNGDGTDSTSKQWMKNRDYDGYPTCALEKKLIWGGGMAAI